MGGLVDAIFGDNKGPSADEQNAQAAAQSRADRDYEAKIFGERDAAARVREAEGQANEMERLRLKEQQLRQRESDESIQGRGVAGVSDVTLGNDDAKIDTEQFSDVAGQDIMKTLEGSTMQGFSIDGRSMFQ